MNARPLYALLLAAVAAGPAPKVTLDSFSQPAQEGNHTVTITFGRKDAATDTTVKAEQRRLMLQHVRTKPGEFVTRTLTINTRTDKLPDGSHVKLKPREKESETREWDDNLSLEFLGPEAGVTDVKVSPAPADTPTLFIMGDSTVCDQPSEPWASWGQMLPAFLKPGIAVANYAESGESLRSSLGAKRLDKILSVIKPGDFLLIQFGHNDMKAKGEGVGAFTTYKTDLKHYADSAKAKGATVILVTSMERKSWAQSGNETLGDYPAAVRQLAQEDGHPLVDLHAMSKQLYKSIGPDLGLAFIDGTHHSNYGAYELAQCVAQGLKDAKVEALTKFLLDDFTFNPTHPDPPTTAVIPPSPNSATTKPEGN